MVWLIAWCFCAVWLFATVVVAAVVVVRRTSIYPIDVLQSRMIAHGERYRGGAFAATRSLLAEGGVRMFARGYPAVLMRSFPVNALLLPVADVLRDAFENALPPEPPPHAAGPGGVPSAMGDEESAPRRS